jgi:chromosomal replication initiator protein
MSDAMTLWTNCLPALRDHVGPSVWSSYFAVLQPLAFANDELHLAAPSTLVKRRLEERFVQLLSTVLSEHAGRPITIRINVTPPPPTPDDDLLLPLSPPIDLSETAATTPTTHSLNPRFTFETFVIGPSNRFAHAAALSVAEAPARSYNPLFIHGAAGLGKTHLLHAIGNYISHHYPTRKIQYVTTETFLNEFVDAIRSNSQNLFKRRYRSCDVLLIDDIQFMEKKEGLQEEFFHTFNSLHQAGKQIVITSDRPPKSLVTLEERLRSRFLSGLTTDIQPPDLETRIAILISKAELISVSVPDDVLRFIASNVQDNIRELEGALTRLTAYANLNNVPITLPLAEEVLSDIADNDRPSQISPDLIFRATAEAFGVSIEDLKGPSRTRPLVTARQICMYLFRQLTNYSYPLIARQFGNRDHTTVIHAVEKISKLMHERRGIYDQVTALLLQIKNEIR